MAQNVGAAALGVFTFGLGWALFQGAAGTDQEALEDRNAYLGQLAQDRCKSEPVPAATPLTS